MRPIDVRNISLGGEIGRRVDITAMNNCLAVDVGRDFLEPFKTKRQTGYKGLGKFIDAVAHLASFRKDADLENLRRRVIGEVVRLQEPGGYIGLFPPDKRFESLWDIHEIAYLVFGLTSDYRLWGEPSSLEAARRLANYLIRQWQATPERVSKQYVMTTLGVEMAMLALYEQTREPAYLRFCTECRNIQAWDAPIVLGRWGVLEGHAYNYLNRCLAQLALNRWAPDPRLFLPTRRALDFMLKQNGMVVIGEISDHECWHNTQEGTINLGETCATAYLIRLLDVMVQATDNALYGDVMERAVFNGLFGAQSPDGRKIRYYTPLDGPRCYFNRDTFCCPNNYRRIVAELSGMVFYATTDGVTVNLYTPAKARLRLTENVMLVLEQATDYPLSGRVLIRVNPSRPARFALGLRIPRWCRGASAEVNGKTLPNELTKGTFYKIERDWRQGDEVALDFSMPFRLIKGRNAQSGRVAVMRGPMLFCLSRARHADLAGKDLRLLVADTNSLEGPINDTTVHGGGQACRLRAWAPGDLYPDRAPQLNLTLTEFADPDGEAVYFKVPNPNDSHFVEDELYLGAT